MHKHFLYFLLFTTLTFSQSRTITSVVADDTNKPLISANVIAKLNYNQVTSKFKRLYLKFL
ncbi:hypothetical protein SAMN05444395_11238 [Flavobacterium fryxellicola]|nr:hypothetical protein SAMN05444395_11238 [Flavobacterium fryxellicola]